MEFAPLIQQVGLACPWLAPLLGLALGAVAGSFLTCAITRIPAGVSLWHPPSRCDGCRRRLTLPDLLPILSYLVWRGRCRTCGSPIGATMLGLEVLSAAVGTAMGYGLGLTWYVFPALLGLLIAYVVGMLVLLLRR